MRFGVEILLLIAAGAAGVIFYRLHKANAGAAVAKAAGAPPGVTTLALGQYAVAPSRQWLLLQPGQ